MVSPLVKIRNDEEITMIALFYEKNPHICFYTLRVGTADDIANQLAQVNDWMCLVNTGRSLGTKEDKPELAKLKKLLCGKHNRKQFEQFRISLSTGDSGCVMCAETEEELKNMETHVLASISVKADQQAKLVRLFEKLRQYLREGETDKAFYSKLASRQHINSGIALNDFVD